MDKSYVVVVDQNKLRRAGVVELLKDWAKDHKLDLREICKPIAPDKLDEHCKLMIMNVGGDSVLDPPIQHQIKILHAVKPDAPLVIISDIDDPEQVVSSFKLGALGFLPSATAPSIALQAISFIINGGTYFPTSALNYSANSRKSADFRRFCAAND